MERPPTVDRSQQLDSNAPIDSVILAKCNVRLATSSYWIVGEKEECFRYTLYYTRQGGKEVGRRREAERTESKRSSTSALSSLFGKFKDALRVQKRFKELNKGTHIMRASHKQR